MTTTPTSGDFGLPSKLVQRDQIIGIFDLVDFTSLESNRDLVEAVQALDTAIKLILEDKFHFGEMDRARDESSRNDIWLRSTGDGYIIAFSQGMDSEEGLNYLVDIQKRIKKKHSVRLGINKGDNYIVSDVNDRVNIVGWGINYAARALGFAEENQIICTGNFADPLIKAKGDIGNNLNRVGKVQVKKTKLDVYNYYKRGEFGAPLTTQQKEKID